MRDRVIRRPAVSVPDLDRSSPGHPTQWTVSDIYPGPNAALASGVYSAMYESAESFEDIGVSLAYLLGAILTGVSCEFSDSDPLVVLLRRRFPEHSLLWRYVCLARPSPEPEPETVAVDASAGPENVDDSPLYGSDAWTLNDNIAAASLGWCLKYDDELGVPRIGLPGRHPPSDADARRAATLIRLGVIHGNSLCHKAVRCLISRGSPDVSTYGLPTPAYCGRGGQT